jgi:hypothetical protein
MGETAPDIAWLDAERRAPQAPGWYATRYGWDHLEGFLCGARYWTGAEWTAGPEQPDPYPPSVVEFLPECFAAPYPADLLACEMDPDLV